MIYVDANATYPVTPKHYMDVAALLQQVDGNPSSIHAPGRNAKVALEHARGYLAQLLGARSLEVVFTSGATEANNLALQGLIGRAALSQAERPPQLIITAAEHSSVMDTAQTLQGRGLCRLEIAPVLASGAVDGDALLAQIGPDTAGVAMMHANNETGAVIDVRGLSQRIMEFYPAFQVHVVGLQLLGKAGMTWFGSSGFDSAAFSAHKIGASKGIGALFLNAGAKLLPLSIGGGQERGRRPGTENMPGIVSFGLRCQEIQGRHGEVCASMRCLRDAWRLAVEAVPGAVVHAPSVFTDDRSLPNTVNFHIEGVSGDDLLLNFDLAGIHASSGSACSSSVARPSHVLLAMGYSDWVALNSVRVSFGPDGTVADVERMAEVLREVVARVRRG
ncbi:MAG: aminotransferase class V-fold PLP-dependent enzyme [Proteobacteria bacterium]|nr:aminotransferase class V-fold PLP-dependent enzyme [Pseudomonadota bacterium]